MKSFKSPLSMFFAFGILFSAANAASAQGLDSGSIRMGSNGPVGSLSGSIGSVGGTAAFTSGVTGTSSGSFGFSVPNSSSSNVSSGNGPQGQQPGGYANGVGSFGSAYNSQGATGQQAFTSGKTNTKYQGNSGYSGKQNSSLGLNSRNNLLSTYSVDQSSFASGSFNYGFKGGNMGTVRGLYTQGWLLPKTSTGSVDINTVSP